MVEEFAQRRLDDCFAGVGRQRAVYATGCTYSLHAQLADATCLDWRHVKILKSCMLLEEVKEKSVQ